MNILNDVKEEEKIKIVQFNINLSWNGNYTFLSVPLMV
jgi:hypothetical protein